MTPGSIYDRDADRLALLEATLSHAAFDGWSQKAFDAGAKDAGIPADRALNAFPGGMSELLAFYHEVEDREMLEAMQRANVSDMRVRDRIAFAVKARLQRNMRHREAIKSACSFLAMPHNAALALRLLYRTVDAMWYGAGDNATDFNFYTKRALLAGVYSTTVLYWLNDKSAGCRRYLGVPQPPDRRGDAGAENARQVQRRHQPLPQSVPGGAARAAARLPHQDRPWLSS